MARKMRKAVWKKIGRNIQLIRESRGLTRVELGLIMGCSYQQVYKFETGQNSLAVHQLILLKYSLGTSYKKLLKGYYE